MMLSSPLVSVLSSTGLAAWEVPCWSLSKTSSSSVNTKSAMKIYYATTYGTERWWYQRFIRGSKNCAFSSRDTALQRDTSWCPVARTTVPVRSALICSKTSNHVNVEPMGTLVEGYTIRKPPYQCRKPAQAVHDCVLAEAHFSAKASPATSKWNQTTVNHSTPLGNWYICFNLSGYVTSSGTIWHISDRTWIQPNEFIPAYPGQLPPQADKY